MNNVLDKCKVIANRMLDAICQAIPEWQAATSDLISIRSNVVCSLENVETILKESLQQHQTPSVGGTADAVNQAVRYILLFES